MLRSNPSNLLAGQWLRLPRNPTTKMHHKLKFLVAVGMVDRDQGVPH
jgi:hypothetical protein